MKENTDDKDIKQDKKNSAPLPKAESLLKALLNETQNEAEIEKEKIALALKQKEEEAKHKKRSTEELLQIDFKRKVEQERKKREEQFHLAEERKHQKELEEKQLLEKSDLIVINEVQQTKRKISKPLIAAIGAGLAVILMISVVLLIVHKKEKDNIWAIPLNQEIVIKQSAYSSEPVVPASKNEKTANILDPVAIITMTPPKPLPKKFASTVKTVNHKSMPDKKQKTGTKLIKTNIFTNKIIK